MEELRAIFNRFRTPVPRYTSYPPVPFWDAAVPTQEKWMQEVKSAFAGTDRQLSLYIHLLFCESLCTYCACNTRITTDHNVELPYVKRIVKEWQLYIDALGATPVINEMHLGGGTPTFFSPNNLDDLLTGILKNAEVSDHAVLSFEAHPANTTTSHLHTLYHHGFTRMSVGVQDFNERVQKLINRRQSELQVRAITNMGRIIGFTSINFDLIYGLPGQTLESIKETIQKVIDIRPDRIAFYGYAHVPSMKPAQLSFEQALPDSDLRSELYVQGRELLVSAGYCEVGLDHFALPGDELLLASKTGKLHRNFMGYTEHQSPLLIGLGPSSISDSGTMLVQNSHKLEEWNAAIDKGVLPITKGHVMTAEDIVLKRHIFNIMCKGETDWSKDELSTPFLNTIESSLKEFVLLGLIELGPFRLKVLERGRPFLRQIARTFDARATRKSDPQILLSKP